MLTIVACLALVLGAGASLAGAQAAPTPQAGTRHLPRIKEGTDVAGIVAGTTTVRKAQQTVLLHPMVLRVYGNNEFTFEHGSARFIDTTSPAWVVQHPGRHPVFGVFPTTHSAVLGFGMLPVTADLILSQVVVNGKVQPLTVKTRVDEHSILQFPAFVSGQVNLRLANVKVDQVPLDVGPHCMTATPLQLNLVGRPGHYNLFTGGTIRGKVTIPPFAGCGVNGDDLDPLLDGVISGPGNTLVQHQSNLGGWAPGHPNDCLGCVPPKPPRLP